MKYQVKPNRRIEHAGVAYDAGAIADLPDDIALFHWDNIEPVDEPELKPEPELEPEPKIKTPDEFVRSTDLDEDEDDDL